MSQLFASGGQSIGASALVLPMNIQDWFPLGMCVLKFEAKLSFDLITPFVETYAKECQQKSV